MRTDIRELEDTELLRKHTVVTEYLENILLEINKRKLKPKEVNSNFPQHLSSSDIDKEDKIKNCNIKVVTKAEKDTDKNNSKLESLTKNELKTVLDENKVAYKVNIKKDELIELIRKHHLVRQATKNNKNSKI